MIEKWPFDASTAVVISAVSPGTGIPPDSSRTTTNRTQRPYVSIRCVMGARRQHRVRLMRVGVPRETATGERRVALVPEAVAKLVEKGFEVLVQKGAGEAAAFEDAAYAEAGARLVDSVWGEAEAIAKVQKPTAEEAGRLRDGDVLIAFLQPLTDAEGIERLASHSVVGFAMES